MSDLGDTYEAEIMAAVIQAVVDVRADSAGAGGVIDPNRAFSAMCHAIGAMAVNFGGFEQEARRESFADQCRQQILVALEKGWDPASGINRMAASPITEQ